MVETLHIFMKNRGLALREGNSGSRRLRVLTLILMRCYWPINIRRRALELVI